MNFRMTVVEEPIVKSIDLNKKNINISKVGSDKEKESASKNEGFQSRKARRMGLPRASCRVSCAGASSLTRAVTEPGSGSTWRTSTMSSLTAMSSSL